MDKTLKVGDEVIIASNLEDFIKSENDYYDIVPEMLQYAGKTTNVAYIHEDGECQLDIDREEGCWFWRPELLYKVNKENNNEN